MASTPVTARIDGEQPHEGDGNGQFIRVIVADTQAIFRAGLRKIFAVEDDLRVVGQAETLAQQAAEVLVLWQHPQAADCLITLALARWKNTGAWTPSCVVESVRLIQADPLLWPADKTRFFEAEADRLARYSRPEDAGTLRHAARQHQRSVDFLSEPTSAAISRRPPSPTMAH